MPVGHQLAIGPQRIDRPKYIERKNGLQKAPYPWGFLPTFHNYRLDTPTRWKEPRTIFVGSMCDLFGDWVPDTWIKEVFKACEAAPQHRYIFLTKNPRRYLDLYEKKGFPYSKNYWFGTTCTTPNDDFAWAKNTSYHTFVSIEPILEPFGSLECGEFPDWVIVGAETGSRKDRVIPERVWIDGIATQCRDANIPIFMKESLRALMGSDFVQEWPNELEPRKAERG